MRVLVLIIIISLMSCNKKDICPEKVYLKRIESQIDFFDKQYKHGYALNGKIMYANLYLSELTKIESTAQYGDISIYKTIHDYKEDLSKWKKWYNKNRCSISEEELIDLEQDMKKSTSWLNIEKNN